MVKLVPARIENGNIVPEGPFPFRQRGAKRIHTA